MRSGREAGVAGMARGLIERLDRTGESRARADVIHLWRTIAGPEVYSHARGFALRDGELVVFVDSHAWANDLAVMSEHYLAAMQSGVGKEAVTSLRFAVSRKVTEEKSREADDLLDAEAETTPTVEPGRATETELRQLRMMAAGIHDAELREAVIAAAIAQLEWRKGIETENAAERAVQRVRGANQRAQR
jgi:hypothetical protein